MLIGDVCPIQIVPQIGKPIEYYWYDYLFLIYKLYFCVFFSPKITRGPIDDLVFKKIRRKKSKDLQIKLHTGDTKSFDGCG